jgi:hypothetical protein
MKGAAVPKRRRRKRYTLCHNRYTGCRRLRRFHKRPAKRSEQRLSAYHAAPRTMRRPLLRTTTHSSQTARRCAKRSRASVAAGLLNGQGVAPFGGNRRPCRNSRRLRPCCASGAGGVLHYLETTGGHAETAGGCGHAVPPALPEIIRSNSARSKQMSCLHLP